MSFIDELLRMPPAYCEKRPGSEIEPKAQTPRLPNGRRVGLFELFGVQDPAIGGRVLLGHGEPMQHAVGYREESKKGQITRHNFVPETLSPNLAANRLDAFMDLTDHTELAGRWSMQHVIERVRRDPVFQASVLLRYFWGSDSDRGWWFHLRPDLELAVRMPPLLGRTALHDLREALDTVLGGQVSARMILDPSDDHPTEVGNLATFIHPRGGTSEEGLERTRTGPPIIGPAPLKCPVVELSVHGEAEVWSEELGFREKEEGSSASVAARISRQIALLYVPPHVRVSLRADRLENDTVRVKKRARQRKLRSPNPKGDTEQTTRKKSR